MDDEQQLRRLQLKTVGKSSTTQSWDIRRRLLVPVGDNGAKLGFPLHRIGVWSGLQGGVVVAEYDVVSHEISVHWLYCDLFILSAIEYGLIPSTAQTRDAAKDRVRDLRGLNTSGDVRLTHAMFVRPKSADSLLRLMGLQARKKVNWVDSLVGYVQAENGWTND